MSGEENTSRQSTRVLLYKLTEFFRSDSLSEDSLRAIIERHGVATNDRRVTNNNYVFFHQACRNKRVTEGILRLLLEHFPSAASATDYGNNMPLHDIFDNSNVTLGMVQLLIDAYPESVRHENRNGWIPLHYLCNNRRVDEEAAVEILKLLLEKCPESVRRATNTDDLPIHVAASNQSPEFCRILVDAYPESVTMPNDIGELPFHAACEYSNVATVKYLYQLYPESININTAVNGGRYPIHYAIMGINYRNGPAAAIKVVQFLLDCDPNVLLQELLNKLPLYWVCFWATKDDGTSKLNFYLKILQTLYDDHPEAIENNEVTSEIDSFCEEVQAFLNDQLTYARQARDHHVMTTQDENGQLPLHKALCDNATITLGSIKLLVKGNPSAVCTFDNRVRTPLHLACQHETPGVVEYLIGLNKVTLGTTDEEGNTVLHYACRGGNHAAIALLLDKYGSISVSKRNAKKQLPIHLLLESNDDVNGRDDFKNVESVYRLMRAHPETIMNSII